MTPFEQFRLWLRRAPVGERVTSTIVGAAVLALVVFILIPVTRGGGGSSTGGVAIGETATTVAGQPGATTPPTTGADGLSEGPSSNAGTPVAVGGGTRVAISGGDAPA